MSLDLHVQKVLLIFHRHVNVGTWWPRPVPLGSSGLLGYLNYQVGIKTIHQDVRAFVDTFKRRASAPVGMFLLFDDDRRLYSSRRRHV